MVQWLTLPTNIRFLLFVYVVHLSTTLTYLKLSVFVLSGHHFCYKKISFQPAKTSFQSAFAKNRQLFQPLSMGQRDREYRYENILILHLTKICTTSLCEKSDKTFTRLCSRRYISDKELKYFTYSFKKTTNLGKLQDIGIGIGIRYRINKRFSVVYI